MTGRLRFLHLIRTFISTDKKSNLEIGGKMDVSLPYLKHKTITIEGFKYEFDDVTSVPGTPIRYEG